MELLCQLLFLNFLVGAFSFVYCTSIFAFWEKVVDYFPEVWYTNGRRKTLHGMNRLVTWRYEFTIIAAWFLGSDFGLTTSLTIYGFGVRGNSAYKSIRKHRFWTKKHQKVNKSSQKTMAYLFGSKKSQVQILSLRPFLVLYAQKISPFRKIWTDFLFIFYKPTLLRFCLIFATAQAPWPSVRLMLFS